ncbi:MAG TPA: DNA polymerase IV [Stenomitos sp.]
MAEQRKILHVDMDAFFASVEQRDNLELRGKPIVVGGRPETRGAVAAASYEARKFGIYSAMPSRVAILKCQNLIFVPPRMDVYRQVSRQIAEVFYRYTDLVEPISLDEAYLDVTETKVGEPSAILTARAIKSEIFKTTELTASAGVSVNKFLAKMASGLNKPDGLSLIHPDQAIAFMEQLPIEKFHGIGRATATRMHQLGIRTGADLKHHSEAELVEYFGKVGRHYYAIARGIDERPVNPNRIRKSVGAERSFFPDLSDRARMVAELESVTGIVEQRLEGKQGHTVTLKIKYADYQQLTRSRTLKQPIGTASNIFPLVKELFEATVEDGREVRLLGISIASFAASQAETESLQLCLTL